MEGRNHNDDHWANSWPSWLGDTVKALFPPLGTSDEHSKIPDPKTSSTPTLGLFPSHAGPGHAPATVLPTHAAALAPVPTQAESDKKVHPTWVFEKYTPIDTKLIDALWKVHTDTRNDAAALERVWDFLKVQATTNQKHAIHDLQMLDQIRHAFEEHQMQHFRWLHIKHLDSELLTKLQERQALAAQIKPDVLHAKNNNPTNPQIQLKDKEIADLRAEIEKVAILKETYKDSEHIPQRPQVTKCKLLGLFVSPTLQRQY